MKSELTLGEFRARTADLADSTPLVFIPVKFVDDSISGRHWAVESVDFEARNTGINFTENRCQVRIVLGGEL